MTRLAGDIRHQTSRIGPLAFLLLLGTSIGTAQDEPVRSDEPSSGLGFPLTGLHIEGNIVGDIAELSVHQTFENHFDQAIEAVYTFPLPDQAAVTGVVIRMGDREVEAQLREREDARETYEDALDEGHAASLLEQERPNLFNMSVANLEPGVPIEVVTTIIDRVTYEDGIYEFTFPLVVGPRFIPGTPEGSTGSGAHPDTDVVPDASLITPYVLPEGSVTPYEVTLSLDLEAPVALHSLESPSHRIGTEWRDERSVSLTFLDDSRQPDRDFTLRFRLAEEAVRVGTLTHLADDGTGFFTVRFEPPEVLETSDIRPRELIFMLDVSGSMFGAPLEVSKAVVRDALAKLNPEDRFNVSTFAGSVASCFERPVVGTDENIAAALLCLENTSGGGGTIMLEGIQAVLEPDLDPDHMRMVMFLTDGYIGNEAEILAYVQENVGDTRIFALGVGSAPNRYLLNSLGEIGRGDALYVGIDEPVTDVVDRFDDRTGNPILTDVAIDWGDLAVSDVLPMSTPDLFAGEPMTIYGRVDAPSSGVVGVTGRLGTEIVRYEIPIVFEPGAKRGAIPYLWAREEVDRLETAILGLAGADADRLREEVLAVALEFSILTQYTAFVAVDKRISNETGEVVEIVVPALLPHGAEADFMGQQMVGSGGFGRVRGTGAIHTGGRGVSANLGRRGQRAPRARVERGSASVSGFLSREQIERVVLRHVRGLRYCYERELQEEPELEGRITATWRVDFDGTVSEAVIEENSMGDVDVESCILQEIGRMRFPEPDGGLVVVRYPFSFHNVTP